MPSSALRSEEHTSELQSHLNLVCRLLLDMRIALGVSRFRVGSLLSVFALSARVCVCASLYMLLCLCVSAVSSLCVCVFFLYERATPRFLPLSLGGRLRV